jgi:hypothetical protein
VVVPVLVIGGVVEVRDEGIIDVTGWIVMIPVSMILVGSWANEYEA